MQIKEACKKWGISERRIRKLIEDGRINGAQKIGTTWNIPDDANKPIDKRIKGKLEFIIDLPNDYFYDIDNRKAILDSKRPLSKEAVNMLQEVINLEWTFNSIGIEGNTLTLKETKVVLEGITVGGKTIKEHLEAINHGQSIEFLEDLLKDKIELSEWNIKCLHQLLLKGIDDKNAGRYRTNNVYISGAEHVPPDYIRVPELMEKLMINYKKWNEYHPIVKAALLHGELVKIHPFIDGNGRISRLIMNMELMKYGYVPVILKKDNRLEYYEALDKAHTTNDYTAFIKLIAKEESNMLDRYLEVID